MKKTFKKQLILVAVIAVMMIFALVLPAGAAEGGNIPCPGADGKGGHIYIDYQVCPPTCTQRGYTIEYCSACNETLKYIDITDPTGHSFDVEYVLAEDGTYTRIRTCGNDWLCARKGYDVESGLDSETETDNYSESDTGYHLITYINKWEPLSKEYRSHKEAHLAECYDAINPATWVLDYTYNEAETEPSIDGRYETKEYVTGKEATVNPDSAVAENGYEYIYENDALKLYVKNDTEIPEYVGKTLPTRNKDLTNGKYKFTGWSTETPVNGVIYRYAQFAPESVNVTANFYNHDGSKMLSVGKTVPYGGTINYGDLVTPSRDSDQKYKYNFIGWAFNKNETAQEKIFAPGTDITVYINANLFATYEGELNKYTLKFRKYPAATESFSSLADMKDYTYGASFADHIKGISLEDYIVPTDKEFMYERDERIWLIKAVNGNVLNSEVELSPYKGELPEKVLVKNKDTGANETVKLGDGDELTVVPKYNKHYVSYRFKVSIKPVYFRDEDIYIITENGQSVLKSEALDDFNIQVTDQNGKYIAGGKTDKDGNFWFTSPYKPTINITASMKNVKYYGEHTLNLSLCNTIEEVEKIANNGIDILPRVTQDWLDGLKGCTCMCHSIFSPLIIRIYNIIYSIFGKEYVCCDDLFIVHGDILAYGKK